MKYKDIRLGDFFEAKYGKSLPKAKRVHGEIKVYGSGGVSGYHNESLVNGPGIIIGRKGTVGSLFYEMENYFPIDTTYYIEKNDRYDLKYLFYLLQTLQLNTMNTHSAVPGLNRENLYAINVKVPSKKYQKKVSSFLQLLDSKIELNNQIISTLEELASTLFKRWFVDFEFPNEDGNPYKSNGGKMVDSEQGEIPVGWEVKKLSSFSTIIMGQSPKGKSYNYDKIGTPLVNGASDFKNGIVTPLKYTTEPKKLTEKGDYIFGVRATVGNVTETDNVYAIGRGAGIARSKDVIGKEFLYFNLINIIKYLESTASGSVYINISRKDLDDFKVAYPSKKVLKLFHDVAVYLLTEKQNKYKENILLQETRDSLLPRLLSGEIEILQSGEA